MTESFNFCSKCLLNKKLARKCLHVNIHTYQKMPTQNAYLTGSVYLKRVPKMKVKVRLNRSKS